MKDPKCEHASLSASERSGDHLLRWLVAKYLRVARYAQSCRWPLTANEEMQLYTSIPQSGSSLLPVLDTIKHIHKIQRGFYHACLFTLCFKYNASNPEPPRGIRAFTCKRGAAYSPGCPPRFMLRDARGRGKKRMNRVSCMPDDE